MAQISDLPVELLLLIFSMLDESTQAICMIVCRQWYTIIFQMSTCPLTGTVRLPRLFLEDMFKSVSLLEWSRALEFNYIFYDGGLALFFAAKYRNLDVVKYLHRKGFRDGGGFSDCGRMCNMAASNGCLDILKFAIDNHYPDGEAAYYAAENEQIHILDYLINKIGAYSVVHIAYRRAATSGKLAVIKFLFEKGYKLDESVFKWAVKFGHLDIVQYLLEIDCTCDEDVFHCARKYEEMNSKGILEFIYENWDCECFE
jgi:ankyrin repeat protein